MQLVKSLGNISTGRVYFGPFAKGDWVEEVKVYLPTTDAGNNDTLIAAVSIAVFTEKPNDSEANFAAGRQLIGDVPGVAIPFVYAPIHYSLLVAATPAPDAGGWYSIPVMWEASESWRVLGVRINASDCTVYGNVAVKAYPAKARAWRQ